jgi:hypothetical protein
MLGTNTSGASCATAGRRPATIDAVFDLVGPGLSRRGSLVRGQGFAATRTRVDCPGRNFVHCSGAAMRIEIIGGRRATNRAGAAEHLQMPIASVQIYSSPAQRPTSSWPEPLENPPGLRGAWFALDELDAYKTRRRALIRIEIVGGRRATDRRGAAQHLDMAIATVQVYSSPARRPTSGWPEPLENPPGLRGAWFALDDLDDYKTRRAQPTTPPPAVAGGDPDELVDVTEFARLRGVSVQVFNTYVQASRVAWGRGEDGMLPRPLPAPAPARHGPGRHYQWLRATAIAWAFPERARRSTGRKKGPRPGVDDLQRILEQATKAGERLTEVDLAGRLGDDVSIWTVKRLKRALRDQQQTT